jgi:DNA replication protein DnaC
MSTAKQPDNLVRGFFGGLAGLLDDEFTNVIPGSESWTDEQWAEHDAKVAAQRVESDRKASEDEQRARRSRLTDAGWPQRALDSAEAADVTKPAVARALGWDVAVESVLVLSGPPGCGKTTAAARWALTRNWSPRFLRATSFAASSRYDQEQRDTWMRAGALVLDDLGAEYADTKGNFLVDLDELVDTFYGDKRPLLITTNCSAEDFKKRYGQRVVDRLRECGSWFSANNASLRRKP